MKTSFQSNFIWEKPILLAFYDTDGCALRSWLKKRAGGWKKKERKKERRKERRVEIKRIRVIGNEELK